MRNKSGIARLAGVFLISTVLLGYNIYGMLLNNSAGNIAAALPQNTGESTVSETEAVKPDETRETEQASAPVSSEQKTENKRGGRGVGSRKCQGKNHKQLYFAL